MERLTAIFLISLLIFSCGCSSESAIPPTISEPETGDNPGGTVGNPSSVSFDKRNIVSGDSFSNYFSLVLTEDTRIHISVLLDNGLQTLEKTRCASDADGGFIRVNGSGAACDHRLVMNFEAGEHEIYLNFPNQGNGYFTIDKVNLNDIEILDADGMGGVPSKPKEFLVGGDNQINKDLLFNYFAYTGDAGDRLVINTYLEESIPTIMYTRCSSTSGELDRRKKSAVGISINSDSYNCEDELDYILPDSGTYYFHFFFMAPEDIAFPVSGYFRVDIQ
ncbi:hypothetical protein [Paraglaciecola sp.]|uniref:hypothetical protein n=1 Tax=Paraglaciecola sp. TaxID=1920173 RepID=UPI0032652E35